MERKCAFGFLVLFTVGLKDVFLRQVFNLFVVCVCVCFVIFCLWVGGWVGVSAEGEARGGNYLVLPVGSDKKGRRSGRMREGLCVFIML